MFKFGTSIGVGKVSVSFTILSSGLKIAKLAEYASSRGILPSEVVALESNTYVQPTYSTPSDNTLFSTYSSVGTSTWSSNNWAAKFNASGHVWSNPRGGTLILQDIIVLNTHFKYTVGDDVTFTAPDGTPVSRIVAASTDIPGSAFSDITVVKLSSPLPLDFTPYAILEQDLVNQPSSYVPMPTVHFRNGLDYRGIFAGEFYAYDEAPGTDGCTFGARSDLPAAMWDPPSASESGSPAFAVIGSQLVLIATLADSTSNLGLPPHNGQDGMLALYIGHPTAIAAINSAIENFA